MSLNLQPLFQDVQTEDTEDMDTGTETGQLPEQLGDL